MAFLPSTTVSGSTVVTRSSALCDNHRAEGRCDVSYWLEAEFWRQNDQTCVRRLSCPVFLPSDGTNSFPLQLFAITKSSDVECLAKRALLPRSTKWWPRNTKATSPPVLRVRFMKDLGSLSSNKMGLPTQIRLLRVPISVLLDTSLESQGRAGSQYSESYDETAAFLVLRTLQCSLEVHWHTRRAFTATSRGAGKTIRHPDDNITIPEASVVKQNMSLTFPPFYSEAQQPNGKLRPVAIPNSLHLLRNSR
jgi:hypothetical protein